MLIRIAVVLYKMIESVWVDVKEVVQSKDVLISNVIFREADAVWIFHHQAVLILVAHTVPCLEP